MRNELRNRLVLGAAGLSLLAFSLACSSSSSSGTNTLPAPSGTVAMSVSDASTEDWAQIGVRILGITFTPQGGGTPVTVYTAPTPAPMLNLVHLDQLSELIGNLQVPAGTYTKATLTISANPGDVTLVSSSNPSAGFDLAPGTAVAQTDIQIKNTTGTAPNLTTTVAVNLATPLVVTAGQVSNMDLEFDLAHPAFIVEHTPASGPSIWAVNFNGPVRHRPNFELAGTILRHAYGQVNSVATGGSSFTMVKEHEVYPIPGTGPAPIPGLQTLTILPDSTNGTLYYDEDTHAAPVTIHDFSTLASTLATKYVRVAARYQVNGTLTAVRVWASSSWANVWLSPEGHVRHVDPSGILWVDNENGVEIPIAVTNATNFFFRTPGNALADATPIGTGIAFLANLQRGFKVHIGVVDPLAANLAAKTVDIEIAKYDGVISGATTSQFTYIRPFANVADSYLVTLPYCAATAKNGKDALGNQILGFKWWNFTFPTLADTGATAIPDFVAAVGGSASFGPGAIGAVKAWGTSYVTWGDGVTPLSTGWSAKWAVLEPTMLPRGTVASPWVLGATSGSFGLSILAKGPNPVTVNLSTVPGSAALVYDVAVAAGAASTITITPVDITTLAGQATIAAWVTSGTPVKVYGIPQADGSIKGYALTYFH
jgi:hypothetical protein